VDLKGLRYFSHVARAGSFSRAASELRVAQPALSRQIARLEEELGVRLLVRHGRGVRLTGAGSILLERSDAVSHFIRQTGDQVRAGQQAVTGHVAFGMPPASGLLLAPPVVKRFCEAYPQATLHVREGISSSLQEWLLDRRIDVAALYNPPPLDAVDILPVLHERMVVIGPPQDARFQKGAAALRIRGVAELPLIMPSLPHNNRRVVEQAAAQHGERLRIVLEVDSVVLTKAMVRQGLGYSILTYASVQDEVARGALAAYPIERPPLIATFAIATLREAPQSRLSRELTKTICTVLRELIEGGHWGGGQLLPLPEKSG
jgi:LysR family nitrogen assimilation transcriptional regulator